MRKNNPTLLYPKPSKDPHYLKNSELLTEIILSKQQDKLTRKAENMLILLAGRIVRKMHYADAMDREDVLQGTILCVLTHWRGFDATKYTNAFAYFTEVIKRGMAKSWKELKKLRGVEDYKSVKVYSMNGGGNDGEGMFNL